GSGKTTLLAQTLAEKRFPAAVIEGDQSTDLDAARLRAVGATAIQINTGRGCHLDAHMVRHALEDLRLDSGNLNGSVVLIENVGNLVCPAAFDLGEAAKVVLLSVTEGEDKPLKYPDMFRAARLMILTKADLLPHVKFDVDSCIAHARNINPSIEALVLSSTSGSGMNEWFSWLEKARRHGG
ncbi:MAG: hydrogenase nickel incorporation protein HypB, partial [Alphaproteobacteria bacterium]|nr:hydrogenase nickel incorporation protein HypB [Alphaproteobacteria bacterium]